MALQLLSHFKWYSEDRFHSKLIDKYLKKDGSALDKNITCIVLGGSGTGKTTIIKQLKIIHQNGFTNEEMKKGLPIIYFNTIRSLVHILNAMSNLGIEFETPNGQFQSNIVIDSYERMEERGPPSSFTSELLFAMKQLWSDRGVQKCFNRRHEYSFRLEYAGKYFLDDLDRIGNENYKPTKEDILRTYMESSLFTEIFFPVDKLYFGLFEFSKQSLCYPCHKRHRLFEQKSVVIFCAALSDYNEVSDVDGITNLLQEDLQFFYSICADGLFSNCIIILLLNKMDIFEEQLKKYPLTICFPEYTGESKLGEAALYIQEQFESRNTQDIELFCHLTYALETSDIQFVFDIIVQDVIEAKLTKNFQTSLHASGLI